MLIEICRMSQHRLKESGRLTIKRRKINEMRILWVVFMVLASCTGRPCMHENALPASESDYVIAEGRSELRRFLFNNDSMTWHELAAITVIADNGQHLKVGGLISFATPTRSLASYKVVALTPSYCMLESFRPVSPLISYSPERLRYRMKLCNNTIRLFPDDDAEIENDKAIITLQMKSNSTSCL